MKLKFIKITTRSQVIYALLLKNLEKHNAYPTHSLEEVKKLIVILEDDIQIYAVKVDGKIVAGFLIFKINSMGWHIFYSAMDYDYQKFRPINFALFNLLK